MAKEFTEDDTFRALSRADFNTARLAVRELHRQTQPKRNIIRALANLGWTADEYRQKHFETIQREGNDK